MNYCPNCGHKLTDNSNFCPNCGKKLNINQDESEQFFYEETSDNFKSKKEHRIINKIVMVISVILGIIIIVTSVYSYAHRYDYYKFDSGWTRSMYVSKGKAFNYYRLIKYPDDHIGELTYFKGEVFQVLERDKVTEIRVATKQSEFGGYYDDVMYVFYYSDNNSNRIIEGDILTVYGKCDGLITYESTIGKSVTIPSFIAEDILIH